VDQHCHDVCFGGYKVDVVVVKRTDGGFDAKGAVVDVNEGKLVGGDRGGDVGEEEASRQGSSG
jgi:hypothetical protein